MLLALWLAQAPPGAPPMDWGRLLLPFAAVFLVMYMMMIRPQKKREAERKKMLASLQKGSLALLRSGILGKIAAVRGSVVTVVVDEAGGKEIKVRVLRSAVERVVTPEEIDKAERGADVEEEKPAT